MPEPRGGRSRSGNSGRSTPARLAAATARYSADSSSSSMNSSRSTAARWTSGAASLQAPALGGSGVHRRHHPARDDIGHHRGEQLRRRHQVQVLHRLLGPGVAQRFRCADAGRQERDGPRDVLDGLRPGRRHRTRGPQLLAAPLQLGLDVGVGLAHRGDSLINAAAHHVEERVGLGLDGRGSV
jgi:hypothetical protein